MTRGVALALGLGALGVGSAEAQSRRPSVAFTAMAVGTDPWFVGGGLAFAQPGAGFVRLRAVGLLGRAGSELASRGELLVELVLDQRTRAWTPFAGGGVAGLFGPDGALDGRLVVLVGVEQRPAFRRGWRLEAGLGGGVRVAVGYRLAL